MVNVNGLIIATLIGLYFLKGLLSVGWSTQERWVATGIYRGLPSSARSWAWLKKCEPNSNDILPGFPQPFRIQADNCLLCSGTYFGAKKKPITQLPQRPAAWESCAVWCTKLHKLCRSISSWCRNHQRAPACCRRSSAHSIGSVIFKHILCKNLCSFVF